jgi:hypothetical protein
MRRAYVCVVAASLGLASPAYAQTFTNVTESSGLAAIRAMKPDGFWVSGLQLVDLDNDGDLDFFFGSHHDPYGVASLNDGHGHFTVAPALTMSEIHLAVDLDEDGKLDVSLGEGDGGGRWWFGGAAGFKKSMLADPQSRLQMLVDLDRDGKLDWVAVGAGSGSTAGPGTRWYRGDGKGGLAAPVPVLGAINFTDLVDLDGDGDLDALSARGNYPNSPPEMVETRVFRNDGHMGFTDVTAQVGLALPGLYIHGWGDVDQDGDVDLIGLENGGAFPEVVYLNDGKGVFVKKPGAVTGSKGKAAGINPGIATVTDLDNDGIADILIGGVAFFHVLRGTGGGSFVAMNAAWGITSDGQLPDSAFGFGDIDGDGDLDLAGYSQTYPQKRAALYRNDLQARGWINVRPVGAAGNRAAMGAVIRVYAAGTQQVLWHEQVSLQAKQVQQNSYAFAETERHFGLGDRATVDVAVQFYPSNKLVRRDGVPARSTVRLGEADNGTVIVPPPEPPLPGPEAPDGGAVDATGGPPADASVPADGRTGPPVDAPAIPATDAGAPTADAAHPREGGDAGASADASALQPQVDPAGGFACGLGGGGGTPVIAVPLLVAAALLVRRRSARSRG